MKHSDPLAYFLTWTTYGTWLPGDDRGWTAERKGNQSPDRKVRRFAMARMQEDALILDSDQRALVETTIREHCRIRVWNLFALNCRTNHVHVVVHAIIEPDDVAKQFKSWCTRRLREHESRNSATRLMRKRWWSEGASTRYINDEAGLETAIRYVLDAQ